MSDGNIMMIQQPKGCGGGTVIIPLKSKRGKYTWNVGQNKTHVIRACQERYAAFLLYCEDERKKNGKPKHPDPRSKLFIKWFRDEIVSYASPLQIEAARKNFMDDHPILKTLSTYDYTQIPLYADDMYGLGIPTGGELCIISKEMEEMLLDKIREGRSIYSDFEKYREKYSLAFPCSDWELEQNFLQQHGVYSFPVSKKENAKSVFLILAIIFGFIAWVGGFVLLASYCNDIGRYGLEVLFGLMAILPFSIIFLMLKGEF